MLARFEVAGTLGVTLDDGVLDVVALVETVGGGVLDWPVGFFPPPPVAAIAIAATTPRTTSAPPTARPTER